MATVTTQHNLCLRVWGEAGVDTPPAPPVDTRAAGHRKTMANGHVEGLRSYYTFCCSCRWGVFSLLTRQACVERHAASRQQQ